MNKTILRALAERKPVQADGVLYSCKKTITLALCAFLLSGCARGGGDSGSTPAAPAPADGSAVAAESPTPEQTPAPEELSETPAYTLMQLGGLAWRVLDIQDGKALIVAEHIIENRMFHKMNPRTDTVITWENSDLRHYLNGEFVSSTFSSEEAARIAETTVSYEYHSQDGVFKSDAVTDKVFLLSHDEASRYFADDAARCAYDASGRASTWWLRSPSDYQESADYVREDGSVDTDGRGYDHSRYVFLMEDGVILEDNTEYDEGIGVRPALWLRLES